MNEYLSGILSLLAGLGAFLIGFKMLSDNIEKTVGKGLRKLFNKTSNNRFIGVGIGALITATVQSSALVTVMVVGLVNASVMNLFQATAIIMGANIGTTITAQIVALQSFDFISFAMLFTIIGAFINLASKKEKRKQIGLMLSGLGLVFLALKFMKDSMAFFASVDIVVNSLNLIANPFLLLFIGIILTALLQSSAAVTSIIISMAAAGLSIGGGGNSVLFLVIGTNIGTCLTALLSSVGTNTNAKRASVIHLLFNLFASIIFITFLIIYKGFMDDVLGRLFTQTSTQIAMFHTFFNLTSTLIFLPFINVFVKLSQIIIKDKKESEEFKSNLDERFLLTPSLAVGELNKELIRIGKVSQKCFNNALIGFVETNEDSINLTTDLISKFYFLHEKALDFIIKISAKANLEEEILVSKIHKSLNDFSRMVEIADNMIKYLELYIRNDLDFSDEVFLDIKKVLDLINLQYENVFKIILDNKQNSDFFIEVDNIEDHIDQSRTLMIQNHEKRLEEGKCKIANSSIFINLVSNLERAGDHLDYIIDTFKS